MAVSSDSSKCETSKETVLRACPKLVELATYTECIISSIGRVQLSEEPAIKMVQLPFLHGERSAYFDCIIVELKDTAWKSHNKYLVGEAVCSAWGGGMIMFRYHL